MRRGALKKLTDAARHWVRLTTGATQKRRQSVPVDDAIEAGMRAMGATDEQVDLARAERLGAAPLAESSDDSFEVYEDNWEDWMFFLQVQTQWLYAGLDGRRVCLNWAGIAAFATMAGLGRRRQARRAEAMGLIELAVLREDLAIASKAPHGRAA